MMFKRKRRMLLMMISIFVVALLSGCSSSEAISVIADMEITFSGADGYGVAEVENAYTWVDNLNLDTDNDGENDPDVVNEVRSAVTYELDKTENLSNGDTVTLTVTVDNSILSKYGYSASDFSNTYTASGLSEGKEIDIFEDVTLECSGIAPFGTATVNKGSEDYGFTISYSMNKSNGLSNGDTVVVTAEYTETSAVKAGVFIKKNVKEYTVSGLQSYFTADDLFPEETLTAIQGEVTDRIHIEMEADEDIWRSWAAIGDEERKNIWNNDEDTSLNENGISLEYIELVLQSPVNDAESTYHNLLNVVYRINISATYKNGEEEEELNSVIYLYYYYTNVIMNNDGSSALDTSEIFIHEDAIYNTQEAVNLAIAEDDDYTCSQVETATIEEIQDKIAGEMQNDTELEEEENQGTGSIESDPLATGDQTGVIPDPAVDNTETAPAEEELTTDAAETQASEGDATEVPRLEA